MKNIFRLFTMVYALLVLPGIGWGGQEVTVFAAASLKDALDEVAGAYSGEVIISYGGSGILARQVAQGAPADVVLLANEAWMDWLDARGAIDRASRVDLLGNTLVLVAPKGAAEFTPKSANDLLERLAGGRLAVGQTRGVPAGIYARQWLENVGFWDKLQPHLAETENVRTALALVSRHEAPMGVVYGSDALADPGVTVVYHIPPELHEDITYPMAAVKGGDAVDFMEFIQSNQAHKIFAKHGFIALGSLK
jgi:molybdate transport system substrate-binding protein